MTGDPNPGTPPAEADEARESLAFTLDPASEPGMVERATRHELATIDAPASLAAAAVVLAGHMDGTDSLPAAAAAARELRLTMSTARGISQPAVRPESPLDEVRARRLRNAVAQSSQAQSWGTS